MTIALVVMVARVAQLQLAPSEKLQEHMQSRVTRKEVPAARGDILDRRYRYVATTEFGYRVVVDPTEFPSPPDEAILKLAEACGIEPAQLGERIVSRMAVNAARLAARAATKQATPEKADVFDALRGLRQSAGSLTPTAQTISSAAPQASTASAQASAAPSAADDPTAEDSSISGEKPLIRYVVISDVLSDEQVELVKGLKLKGVGLELRGVRHYPAGVTAASLIGKVNPEQLGLIGIERTFQKDLAGEDGQILYVRDARGRALWMGPEGFESARRGQDVRLSIDLEIQRIAHEELTRRVEECDAAGGRCVVLDPMTGEVLAMVDVLRHVPEAVPFPWPAAIPRGKTRSGRMLYEPPPEIPRARYQVIKPDPLREKSPELARNRCIEDVYEPGSTFKAFVWASATELGVFRPDEVLSTGMGYWRTPYGRPIRDVHKHEQLTWHDVLVESSNIGMSQAADKMSFDQMYRAIRRFGFGARTGLGLQGETRGLVTSRKSWSKYTQTSVSFGQEVAVTPVQMVQAFSVFARPGELAGTIARARMTAVVPGDPAQSIVNRVLSSKAALLARDAMRSVAAKVDENMAKAKSDPAPRYNLFGKSGTAQIPLGKAPPGKMRPRGMGFFDRQYNSSFIAAGPTEDPKLVVLVVIDDPGPELRKRLAHYGSTTAGPAVRRIMERSLAYLGVPPSPVIDTPVKTPTSSAD